ncbi:transposase [Nocardia sp. NBC_00881]|uniref:transposase n=1 Tax=Nocardia sp. NBC_00881 TaxID=2975995 RepID=UPI003865348B
MCSGIEGTVCEFANGHGMRQCRYRGEGKAHVQHVLTAIAVNVERLSRQSPSLPLRPSRSPTAFQDFLDRHGLSRPLSWRAVSH